MHNSNTVNSNQRHQRTGTVCGIRPLEVITELNNLPTPAPITTTTLDPSLVTLNCNFDKNFTCGWFDDLTADFQWLLNKGSTLSGDTGPTTGNENMFYLYN